MKLLTLTYRRIHNLGNYENEQLEATAEVGVGEEPARVLRELKKFVQRHIGIGPSKKDIIKAKKILEDWDDDEGDEEDNLDSDEYGPQRY